ncbi:uncharacterized protein (PEP-CTERM system associated) [Janthinobacterium sp. CG_23.3]|uniref:TIGR03016 family PEP-CTERM system-associated outer membrane protein n=1 Tax=Janthinobacterium sp. CG_23.3 TaxID=3349634 RepID=UPI0038D494AA
MAITTSQRRPPPRRPSAAAPTALAVALAVALAAPPRAGAADWSVVPALRLSEGYTDNVLLAPAPQAKDDFITEISPSVVVRGRSQRLRVDLAYRLQQLFYTRRGDRTEHQLQGDANAELLEDWLFLDLRASVGQNRLSAFGPQPLNNVAADTNQSTVRAGRVSPYLRHQVRGVGSAELRYAHERVGNGSELLTVATDELLLDLVGDTGAGGLGWEAHLDRRETSARQRETVRMDKATLSLRYHLSSRVGLFASAGHEDAGYRPAGGAASSGGFWLLGASWYPSARSSVALSGGKRFFGNTYALDLNHRSRHTSWSLGYHEDISSTPSEWLRLSDSATASMLNQLWRGAIPDPQLRQQRVDSFVRFSQLLGPDAGAVNYFSQRYFLQRRAALAMASATAKSTLVLGLTATRRSAQSSGGIDSALLPAIDFALEERTRQVAANAGWNWRLSARSNVNVSAAYATVTSLNVGRKDSNAALSVGLSRQLQRKVSGTLELRRVRHASNRGGDYRENAINASLNFLL